MQRFGRKNIRFFQLASVWFKICFGCPPDLGAVGRVEAGVARRRGVVAPVAAELAVEGISSAGEPGLG